MIQKIILSWHDYFAETKHTKVWRASNGIFWTIWKEKSQRVFEFFLLLWHLCTVLVYFGVPSFENVINNSLLPF